MSNVEFEEDFDPGQAPTQSNRSSGQQFSSTSNVYNQGGARGMTGWLMRKGIIKEESQAKGILLGVVVFNIISTTIIIIYFL